MQAIAELRGWTLLNPAGTAPIIGARTVAQLEDNLGALEVTITDEQRARLEEASAIDPGFPHELLTRPRTRRHVFDGTHLENHTHDSRFPDHGPS